MSQCKETGLWCEMLFVFNILYLYKSHVEHFLKR